jgi:membrane protein YqaA with SNARE-associated domain
LTSISGAVIGFFIGIGLLALIRRIFQLLARYEKPEKVARYQTAMLILLLNVVPISSPVLALCLARVVVSAGLHL